MGTASTLRGHLTKHKQSEQHILHKENDKRRGDNQTDRLNGHNKPRNDKKISKILSHKRKNGLKKIRRTLKKEAESGESLISTLKDSMVLHNTSLLFILHILGQDIGLQIVSFYLMSRSEII